MKSELYTSHSCSVKIVLSTKAWMKWKISVVLLFWFMQKSNKKKKNWGKTDLNFMFNRYRWCLCFYAFKGLWFSPSLSFSLFISRLPSFYFSLPSSLFFSNLPFFLTLSFLSLFLIPFSLYLCISVFPSFSIFHSQSLSFSPKPSIHTLFRLLALPLTSRVRPLPSSPRRWLLFLFMSSLVSRWIRCSSLPSRLLQKKLLPIFSIRTIRWASTCEKFDKKAQKPILKFIKQQGICVLFFYECYSRSF